ncbi:helix-turn-helix domain-containing protein [Paenibacillus sanfengchensis]|uniref:helix-turn-helix domain-containing protein n=1 Tax=Paenibacillus sanfengchensis TaxID=3119819 RepID=UPI002FE020F0
MMNVLLVDDEPLVLDGLRTMIKWEQYGFRVCGEASNGPEAFGLIQRLMPELVLTDIRMPVYGGLELIKRSNRALKRPPKFVVLSGYDDFNYALTAMRQRVAEYLLKPIDEEEIEAILERLGAQIQGELAAEETHRQRQLLFAGNILGRLTQGEYNEGLEQQAIRGLNLPGDAELICVLVDGVADRAEVERRFRAVFPEEPVRSFHDSAARFGFILPASAHPEARLQEIGLQLGRPAGGTEEAGPKSSAIIAVSGRLRGIRAIRELYLQAKELCKTKRCQGKAGLFYFRDQETFCPRQDTQLQEKFGRLLDCTGIGDTAKLDMALDEVFGALFGRRTGLAAAKALVADLEFRLCRMVQEMEGAPDAYMHKVQGNCGRLSEVQDYPALKRYVHCLCLEAGSLLSELRLKNENNTIFHVIRQVDREYRTKLQLQDLARHYHLNATYLGQLFKKQTGKTFNEYLHEKRIAEAKRLLKRSQMKISEIALQVGYPNADYFISKFKSKTGVLPSAYKQEPERKRAD